ncbi:MBL fold metallo-hydrolase [Modestobacter sp. L9-4]|uniref:MBL fold metallo-hydrolase n=1 Tax=Modestobacter sp. L9-4 TaxID=2851567 RepID=UPI001C75661B|nr:MBL fold metallo-hydrolase [Modestobacter sp. L9-4]QXG74609.1 MBL fold metallo-hydrolase [Modestobacter sp. L9-4]
MSTPSLHFLGHSTVRAELAGRTVLTDPLLTPTLGPLRRMVAPLPATSWAGVDLVLISHLHNDHLHLPSLRLLGRSTPIVVPRGAGRWLTRHGFTAVQELGPGESLTDGSLTVTATHADHAAHRWGPRLTHGPHAPAVGHLLRGDGVTVYAAGDTDAFPGMTDLGDDGIDVALVPVWGWGPSLGPGHLDPAGAAAAVQQLRPQVAVPVHWGTYAIAGLCSLPSPWRTRMRDLLVDPPRRFATDVAALAAAGGAPTQVALTAPGSPVVLPAPVEGGS